MRLARINQREAGLPTFATLTYPGEWSKDWKVWKRNLDWFFHSLQRAWPEVWGVWRLEFQKRGAPHFHLLLWDGPRVQMRSVFDEKAYQKLKAAGKVFRDGEKLPEKYISRQTKDNRIVWRWFEDAWKRAVGLAEQDLPPFVRVEGICTWNGASSYVSKYLAKMPEGKFVPVDFTGRFWGVIGKDKWKVDLREETLSAAQWYDFRRVLNRIRIKKGGVDRNLDEDCSVNVLLDTHEAGRLLDYVKANPKDGGRRAPF